MGVGFFSSTPSFEIFFFTDTLPTIRLTLCCCTLGVFSHWWQPTISFCLVLEDLYGTLQKHINLHPLSFFCAILSLCWKNPHCRMGRTHLVWVMAGRRILTQSILKRKRQDGGFSCSRGASELFGRLLIISPPAVSSSAFPFLLSALCFLIYGWTNFNYQRTRGIFSSFYPLVLVRFQLWLLFFFFLVKWFLSRQFLRCLWVVGDCNFSEWYTYMITNTLYGVESLEQSI